MKKNVSITVIAEKNVGRFVLFVLGAAAIASIASSQPAVAAGQSEPCSLAIVTKQPVGSAHICDPKTVRSLAKHGQVFEQNQMGIVSMLAIGPGYSPADALQWFERAARKGYAPAQVNLAVMYANGWGTSPNYGAALHWLHQAADQGFARAYYNLGILYQMGKGVPQDYNEAYRYFGKGAESGDTGAQTNLGYFYDRGLGVARNSQTAADWYRKAADAGEALAQNDLADMYLRGEGVPQDDAAAFRLFQQAAAQGHTGARIKLGYMYSAGRGTSKDLVTAYAWIAAASLAGDARGRDLLRSIEAQLSTEQISRAKDQARNLRAEPDPQFSAKALLP